MKKTTAWKTKDGNLFEDYEDANKHEFEIFRDQLKIYIDENLFQEDFADEDSYRKYKKSVIEFIEENAAGLKHLLNEYYEGLT